MILAGKHYLYGKQQKSKRGEQETNRGEPKGEQGEQGGDQEANGGDLVVPRAKGATRRNKSQQMNRGRTSSFVRTVKQLGFNAVQQLSCSKSA